MERRFYTYLTIFLTASVFGYFMEVFGMLLTTGKLVDRGFLNLPFLPIYGFGSVLLTLVLGQSRKSRLALFVASVFLCSAVEYFSGYVLDHAFGLQLWDYSGYSLNLDGYIAYWSSIGFGVGGMLVVGYVSPALDLFISRRRLTNLRIVLWPLVLIVLVSFLDSLALSFH